jgi:hypothetical protein
MESSAPHLNWGASISLARIRSLMQRFMRSTAPWLWGCPTAPRMCCTLYAWHRVLTISLQNSEPLSDCRRTGVWVWPHSQFSC